MATKSRLKTYNLHIISDATGNLADHMVNSALSQFHGLKITKHHHVFKDSSEKIGQVLRDLPSAKALVCHSVICPELKQQINCTCQERGIPCYDLTCNLVEFLSKGFNQPASNDESRIHRIDEFYLNRIDAMEFTMQHDDARRLETVHEADIVIIGLSRVSKSPTSVFLGSLGFKTANVSIDINQGLPNELDRCRGKIVALTMSPKRLHEIRERRFQRNGFSEKLASSQNPGVSELSYLNLRDVVCEVSKADAEYRKRKYQVIDVTHKTIEETSAEIIELLKLRRQF